MSGRVIFSVLFLYAVTLASAILRDGIYRIENVNDGLHLTTEGGNSSFARVVAENWQNFGEQKWEVRKYGPKAYQLMPTKHRTNNPLSYYRDPSKKYPSLESWILVPMMVQDRYQIQNARTSSCVISGGRRKEVSETKCDKHVRNQHWRFHPI